MRITPIAASVATSLLLLSGAANATVTLTGADLTQDQAWRIAQGEEVAISKKAMKQVTDSNRLVMAAARAGVEIYGLTVGVGLNKDHHLFDAKGDLTAFPDGDSVQPWAETAMTWANGNELINGHDDGTLEPGGTTTRAQAASILMRFDQNVVEN